LFDNKSNTGRFVLLSTEIAIFEMYLIYFSILEMLLFLRDTTIREMWSS